MDNELLLELLTRLAFLVIFLAVLRGAVLRPYRANLDIALFFGALLFALSAGWVWTRLGFEEPVWLPFMTRTAVVALPYLLLRIVADFSDVPTWLLRSAEVGLLAAAVAVAAWPELPQGVTAAIVAYFVAFHLYAAVKFLREARGAHGVTQRRMQAAATGTVLFGGVILIAGAVAALGAPEVWGELPLQLALLGAATAYLVGFAPPLLLRRAWQEPGFRSFLRQAVELPWLEDLASTVRGIEQGAAATFGAAQATVSLWDADTGTLRMVREPPTAGAAVGARPGEFIVGRAFEQERPILAPDAEKADPANADVYREWDARAVIAAPITAGRERLGVLAVFGPRSPLFADDDLDLIQLLADQAALVLEKRRLLERTAEVRAREEATRLKDDFLSAAAHDLRTPLTSILGSAQLLEQKAGRDGGVDLRDLHRLTREAERLQALVTRLLDVGRRETGELVADDRERVALAELAAGVCKRHSGPLHRCVLQAEGPVEVEVDRLRIVQLLENLVENGKKYSPDGGEVTVKVWQETGPEGPEARISVRDRGIGVPPEDRPHLFERFRRGSNVDDRHFSGMGLGLYICRVAAEQHGGRIWLESAVGEGSTFHVALPLTPRPSQEESPAP